jgi:hypothetical protein
LDERQFPEPVSEVNGIMATNLLFVGDLDRHGGHFLRFLAAHGYNVTVINTCSYGFPDFLRDNIGTGPIYNLYENRKVRFIFKGSSPRAYILKAASSGILQRLGYTFTDVRQIIMKKEIDVIYGRWGIYGLPELRLISKFNVPIVYEFLYYPLGFTKTVEKIENFLNKSVINSLAGRVLASSIMLDYMKRTFDLRLGSNIVFTESYSKRCFYKKRLPKISNDDGEPHLVFTGLTNWDILPQVVEMLRRKIHVHVCETTGIERRLHMSRFKDFCHTYKNYNTQEFFDGSFATFMTQFDACLVTYDWRRATSAAARNSLPSRFSAAFTAAIPFVTPKGCLKSCEDIINKHQIGFAYANYDELRNKLDDTDLMCNYEHNIVTKSNIFTLENNFEKINKFFKGIARA